MGVEDMGVDDMADPAYSLDTCVLRTLDTCMLRHMADPTYSLEC